MSNLLPANAPLLVFIGPSAVGKSTLVAELVKQGLLEVTPTWTDRRQRPDEIELEHKFVSRHTFDKQESTKFFAHPPLTFFGLPYRYATPHPVIPESGVVPAVMARFQAVNLVTTLFPNRVIYQIEASQAVVAERLAKRTKAGDEIGTRLHDYETEIIEGRNVANRIFDQVDLTEMVVAVRQALKIDFWLRSISI